MADFCVDIATTAEERARGLRGRESLCESCGLLIEFPRATEACIVNSGVGFAIDVVYISDDLQVSALELDVAADDATSRCHPDVRYVLEVSAGAAALVMEGDKIER